jgi:hypothetical protein
VWKFALRVNNKKMEANDTTEKVQRKCRDCGAELGPGREDRQYCDDGCRTNYNNRVRRERQKAVLDNAPVPEPETFRPELSVPEYITRIQDIILKNRKILESLCNEDKPGRIRLRDLIGKGFNTKFFTSETEPTGTGNIYRFCFEYGYREDEDGVVVIICRKREVY